MLNNNQMFRCVSSCEEKLIEINQSGRVRMTLCGSRVYLLLYMMLYSEPFMQWLTVIQLWVHYPLKFHSELDLKMSSPLILASVSVFFSLVCHVCECVAGNSEIFFKAIRHMDFTLGTKHSQVRGRYLHLLILR